MLHNISFVESCRFEIIFEHKSNEYTHIYSISKTMHMDLDILEGVEHSQSQSLAKSNSSCARAWASVGGRRVGAFAAYFCCCCFQFGTFVTIISFSTAKFLQQATEVQILVFRVVVLCCVVLRAPSSGTKFQACHILRALFF